MLLYAPENRRSVLTLMSYLDADRVGFRPINSNFIQDSIPSPYYTACSISHSYPDDSIRRSRPPNIAGPNGICEEIILSASQQRRFRGSCCCMWSCFHILRSEHMTGVTLPILFWLLLCLIRLVCGLMVFELYPAVSYKRYAQRQPAHQFHVSPS
jgi:hypothetical protein